MWLCVAQEWDRFDYAMDDERGPLRSESALPVSWVDYCPDCSSSLVVCSAAGADAREPLQAQLHVRVRCFSSARARSKRSHVMHVGCLRFKLKILIGFLQIATNLAFVVDIPWPRHYISFINTFNLVRDSQWTWRQSRLMLRVLLSGESGLHSVAVGGLRLAIRLLHEIRHHHDHAALRESKSPFFETRLRPFALMLIPCACDYRCWRASCSSSWCRCGSLTSKQPLPLRLGFLFTLFCV